MRILCIRIATQSKVYYVEELGFCNLLYLATRASHPSCAVGTCHVKIITSILTVYYHRDPRVAHVNPILFGFSSYGATRPIIVRDPQLRRIKLGPLLPSPKVITKDVVSVSTLCAFGSIVMVSSQSVTADSESTDRKKLETKMNAPSKIQN